MRPCVLHVKIAMRRGQGRLFGSADEHKLEWEKNGGDADTAGGARERGTSKM